jgi:hypothetical protein
MDSNLVQAGEIALENADNLRVAQTKATAERRRTGQAQASYVRTDANQGLIEVADNFGGRSLLQEQGGLSNRAIQSGETVRLYQDGRSTGWQAADWKPAASLLLGAGAEAGAGEGGGEEAGGGGGGDGDGDLKLCQRQCFWFRGFPSEEPLTLAPPSEQLDWDMSAGPIEAVYPSEIESIVSLGGQWSPNPDLLPVDCPVGVNFEGNAIYSPFDDPYTDNEGTCSYTVNFVGVRVGPPPNADPNKWQAICSDHPPVRYSAATTGSTTRVTVWDQVTTEERPITVLAFEAGRYTVAVRCHEEGAP